MGLHRGEFADGEPHGAGELTWPDGDVFSGTWRAGNAHGCMKLTTPNDVSEVEYVDGVAAADTGTAKYNDGARCECEFRYRRPHGIVHSEQNPPYMDETVFFESGWCDNGSKS